MKNEELPEPEQWSSRRWKQLEALERLLIECESIDNGSGILWRLKFLIAEAEKLRDSRGDDCGRSFIRFLQEQARYQVHGPKRKKAKA